MSSWPCLNEADDAWNKNKGLFTQRNPITAKIPSGFLWNWFRFLQIFTSGHERIKSIKLHYFLQDKRFISCCINIQLWQKLFNKPALLFFWQFLFISFTLYWSCHNLKTKIIWQPCLYGLWSIIRIIFFRTETLNDPGHCNGNHPRV